MKYFNRLVLISELCVVKLHDEFFPLLDLLAMVLNPANKFHCYNASRPSEFKLRHPLKTAKAIRIPCQLTIETGTRIRKDQAETMTTKTSLMPASTTDPTPKAGLVH